VISNHNRDPIRESARRAENNAAVNRAWRWLGEDSLEPLQEAGFRFLAVHRSGFGGKALQGDERYKSICTALEARLGRPLYSSTQLTLFRLKDESPPRH